MEMQLHPFYYFLKKRSEKSLPGENAHREMAPVPLNPDYNLPETDEKKVRPSAVLVLLYPDESQKLHILFTLRTNTIRHAGQISFPGGRSENGEELLQTALRETREEIGVDQKEIRIACSLSPYTLHKSESRITPFVGFLLKRPHTNPNPDEVEEIFSCNLDKLMNKHTVKQKKWSLLDHEFEVPYWDIHEVPLWGATAMMLNELLNLYSEYRNSIDN
jgi:8-oxo-dGTP pyrophosphatase MutT (NUDIX family)